MYCILHHNLLSHLQTAQSVVVARFPRHPQFPVTQRWCVVGEAWQGYEEDDSLLLPKIPNLSTSWMNATKSPDCSPEADIITSNPSHTFWAHPNAHLNPLPPETNTEISKSQCRCIFLGPQQSARKAALPDLLAAKVTGIVNCTLTYPNAEDVNIR